MQGYWNQPALTADALRGGWMHTGDGGYMDDDGFVFVVDRIKDMIITGGENVYSAEVENAIYQHPAVAMCAVIGVPDEQWGERVHAVVSLKPGQTTTEAAIVAHCRRADRRLQMPAIGQRPRRTAAAERRRQGAENGAAKGAASLVEWFATLLCLSRRFR